VNVTSVNDPPLGTDKTVTTDEDSPYTFTTGDFGFSDPNDSPANVLSTVKITTLPAAGTLMNGATAVSAGDEVAAISISAGDLKFVPAANANGSPYASFTFQVKDDGGTANGGVNLDQSPNTITVNVTSVNDAPQGANNTVSTDEDTPYTFAAADFGFSDPNDSPANSLLAVKITTLASNWTLKLSGVAVTAGQVVPVASITAGNLKFVPDANENGSPYATFTFQVQDNGGTANGGIDLDPTPNTMTVNVTSVNDAPQGANNTVSTDEDTPYTFAAADFGFSDPNDSPANSLLAVKITTVASNGTLKLSGVAVTGGQFVSATDIAAGNLKFVPDANENGSPYATFTFQVQDNGGTANGGVDLDPTPNTMTVNVRPINDAPTASSTPANPSVLEDGSVTITLNGSDQETAPVNLTFTITDLPDHGTLKKGGTPLALNDAYVGSGADVVYEPTANYNGPDSFSFQVTDRGDPDACGAVTATCAAKASNSKAVAIAVTPVNDAPAGADKTVTTNEDVDYTFAAGDFGFTDPNDSPANGLLAVKITTLATDGTLKLSGVAVTAGQVVPVASITAGNLKFVPDANENGSPYATFTFQVQDNGGTANGGVDLDQSANTVTINVTPVNDKPVVTLSTASVSGQYSDPIPVVTVTATDIDTKGSDLSFTATGLPGDVVLTANNDGTTTTPTAANPGTRTATISGRLNVACAGTQPSGQLACTLTSPYSASITAKDSDNAPSDPKTLAITVTRENAQIVDFTPYATFVDGTDGDVDSLTVGMVVDEAQDGNLSGSLASGIGLANAKPIPVNLAPVGTGSSYTCTATNTAYISGDPDSARASCTIANAIVNVYDATATIGGDYFTGNGEGVITIMDPSLGFTTGGGWFNYGDAKVNFGFNAKILKSGQVQGSVLTIFKRSNGNYIVKSNSMGALAVTKVTGQTYYSATLDGKATYAVPSTDPALAPFCPGVWKCGGYSFRVYVEDRQEPGAGYDRYWIEVKDPSGVIVAKADIPAPAATNAVPIVGGNIQVPQPQSGK
jgi:hypothetical protein